MADDETASSTAESGASPAARPDEKSENFLQKIKHAPPWVWIGLAIALGTLVVGYLAYQHSVATQQGTPTAPGTLPPGSTQPGNFATQSELQNLQQEIQNLQQQIHGGYGGGGGGHRHRRHG